MISLMTGKNNTMKCFIIPPKSRKFRGRKNTIFFPENELSVKEQQNYVVPKGFDIVTQSAFIVGLFRRKDVRILEKGKLVTPESETYGSSYEFILSVVFGLDSLIPTKAFNEMTDAIKSQDLHVLHGAVNNLGESFEKRFLFQEIHKLTHPKKS